MIEILYNTETLLVRAWCTDPLAMGNFSPAPDEAVTIFYTDPPARIMENMRVDLIYNTIEGTPPVLDKDTARAIEILRSSPVLITMPDIWELLRIIGKRFGWYPHD